jgi:TPP-dependent pyruvate/acetoin dehydrogenase alpha subunit
VDGNDVLAVYDAAKRAVDRAREGGGVTLLELRTYRRKGHAQHDPQDYVPKEEIARWEARDPIHLFRHRLLQGGVASENDLRGLEEECNRVIEEAARSAVEDPFPPAERALENVYTDLSVPRPWTREPNPTPRPDPEADAAAGPSDVLGS